MKAILFAALLGLGAGCKSDAGRALTFQAPTGAYVGLAEMKGFPAEKPGDRWYHENTVYIRPDSLFLEGNPVVVARNGEKSTPLLMAVFILTAGVLIPAADN